MIGVKVRQQLFHLLDIKPMVLTDAFDFKENATLVIDTHCPLMRQGFLLLHWMGKYWANILSTEQQGFACNFIVEKNSNNVCGTVTNARLAT